MKTILLPTDFSENSLAACHFAINMLGDDQTKFILNYVYDIPRGGTSGLFYLMEELHKQGEKDLKEFSNRVKSDFKERNLTIETRLDQGNFADQTTKIAENLEVDCIAMGSKGTTALKEVLVGSNTLALMKETKKPLYIIPQNYKDSLCEKVIVAFDGGEMSEKTTYHASYFAKKHQLDVEFLHVRKNEEPPVQDWSEVKERFKDLNIDFHESWGENLEEGLKKGIKDTKGLLVMTIHKPSFWERFFNISDTRNTVMQAEIPVLVVHE